MAVVADEIASAEYGTTLDSVIRPHLPHPRLPGPPQCAPRYYRERGLLRNEPKRADAVRAEGELNPHCPDVNE
jgi:hypothetical protein